MQPSFHEVATVAVTGTAISDGGSNDRSPNDAGNISNSFEICGPLKVRLKRQRKGTAAAASTAAAVAQDSVYTTVETFSQLANIEPPQTPSENGNHIDASSSFTDNAFWQHATLNVTSPKNIYQHHDLEAARGSRVNFSGIVWLESSGPGELLVLHGVNWRGRRYAGALLSEDASPSFPKARRSAAAHRRRGRRRHQLARYQHEDDRQHRGEGDFPLLEYSQLPEQSEASAKYPLVVDLSSDGSRVYRVTPKQPPAVHIAENEIVEKAKTSLENSEQIKLEELNDVKNKAESDKAAQSSMVYSDISDDESSAVPVLNDLQPLTTAALSSEPSVDYDPTFLAAYAWFLFERHQQGLPGIQQQQQQQTSQQQQQQ